MVLLPALPPSNPNHKINKLPTKKDFSSNKMSYQALKLGLVLL